MNLRHKLCALLMLALWLPYYAHCIEPHCQPVAFGGAHFENHHHHERDDHGHEHESPWGECHQHDPASLAKGTVKLQPPAAFDLLASCFTILIERPRAIVVPPVEHAFPSGAPPPLQTLLVKTALPVRGPAA